VETGIGSWLSSNVMLICATISAVALAVGSLGFFLAARKRHEIEQALKSIGAPQLKPFDLSYGDASGRLAQSSLVAPEKLWTYDETYLEEFSQRAGASLAPNYINATLLRRDMLAAIGLALFAATVDAQIAVAWSDNVWLSRIASFACGMALVYGASDLAENRKLATVLRSKPINRAQTAAANVLTRVKMMSIFLSGAGFLAYVVLKVISSLIESSDKDHDLPAPAADEAPAT
jgi:hypothetical protein